MSDREKISFSELDKRRRAGKNGGPASEPRNDKGRRRNRATAAAYKRRVEEQLFGRSADAPRQRLEERLRKSHETPNFLRTYREYVKGFGMPAGLPTLLLLLDLDDEREVLRVLETLGQKLGEATPEQRSLVRSRLRNLEMSTQSDNLANAAGELLARL
jgi:hypothetical protein